MKYIDLIKPLKVLIKDEIKETALLGNVSAFLFEYINDLNWLGFYLNDQNTLYLGPFQGKTAASIIEYGKGVCGTVLKEKATIVVPDVHKLENHIVCDTASNSEVVIPIIINNKVYGLLDVDSPVINRFDQDLVSFFEEVVKIVKEKLISII